MGFDVSIKTRPPTRRGILYVAGSVFDPFGFVTPFVLPDSSWVGTMKYRMSKVCIGRDG